jgi:hypothetical protein
MSKGTDAGVRRVGVRNIEAAVEVADRFAVIDARGVERLSVRKVGCVGRRGMGS